MPMFRWNAGVRLISNARKATVSATLISRMSGDGQKRERKLRGFIEISLRQACNESFENINDKDITPAMNRRMSQCLQMAGWRKDGKFTSGPQRNQARFVKDAEEALEEDNEQTTYSF